MLLPNSFSHFHKMSEAIIIIIKKQSSSNVDVFHVMNSVSYKYYICFHSNILHLKVTLTTFDLFNELMLI